MSSSSTSSTFSEESALRLATLRSKDALTPDEQDEVVQLEKTHTQHRNRNPNFSLPIVDSSSRRNIKQKGANNSNNNDNAAATSSGLPSTDNNNNGGGDFEVMENDNDDNANHHPNNNPSNTSSSSSTYGNYFSSVVKSVSDHLPSKESLDNAAKASWFWTSVAVGTAAPSVLGKSLGVMSENFDHWNWIIPAHVPKKTKDDNGDEQVSDEKKCGGLILGALPVVSEVLGGGNHLKVLHKELNELGVEMGMVVSALYEEEMKGFGVEMVKFATHDEWRKEFGPSMVCKLVQVDDCTPNGLEFEQVDKLLQEMDDMMMGEGRTVELHCKAGKGRSALLTYCYLIAHRNMSFDAAITLVKARRPQVNPSKSQIGFVLEYYKRHMENIGKKVLEK